MKIHLLELRGAGEETNTQKLDYSMEFCDITDKGLDNYQFDNNPINFHIYFTKNGKKTIRAFQTYSQKEHHRFISFYSRKTEELFETNDDWREILVKENGFV